MQSDHLEVLPNTIIRTETALSRFPFHRLSKRGDIAIEINQTDATGVVKTRWEVTHNSKFGQPGPLAYKFDTLIVNRRIEEAGKPVPKLLKLGSLKALAEELGLGGDTSAIKRAIRQNASAFISAKVTYTATDRTERTVEADFTRYSVVFTGEKLPDGTRADAVYLLLNDIYMQVLNTAQTRPLDYDYLKELAPAPQRFYEILSYQIFAALKNNHAHAKLIYSEYCTYSTQTRYFDWEHARKQMYKVYVPHLKSGYISKVEFQEQRNDRGALDWLMLFTPGSKAKAEHSAAQGKSRTPRQSKPATALPKSESPPTKREATPEPDPLATQLIGFRIGEQTAQELVRDYRKSVELQLTALPHRNLNKIRDLASWLVVAIKENHELPQAVTKALAKEDESKEAKARRGEAEARNREEADRKAAYYDYLRKKASQVERKKPVDYQSFLRDAAAQRAALENDSSHKGQAKKIYLRLFDDEESHLERFRDFFHEPAFESWQKSNGKTKG